MHLRRAFIGESMHAALASNGAGKTALASAVVWALSGKLVAWQDSSGKTKMAVDEVINSRPDVKTAVVSVTLSVGDEELQVVRSRSKGRGARLGFPQRCGAGA
jgi:DNA repair exonuclease SbcCD ATPase subunit